MADSSILNLTNTMTTKPATADRFAIADADVVPDGETKQISPDTIYAYTLMTDESRTITAGGVTVNDGIKIKYGTDGDLEIYHTDPDSFIKNTKTSGLIKIQATDSTPTTVDMMILDPGGPTIAIGTCNLARAANNTHGITFDVNGKTTIKKELITSAAFRCGGNIDLDTNVLSGDGGATGLEMTAGNAIFGGTLASTGAFRAYSTTRLDGAVDLNANITSGSSYFSYDGTNKGLQISSGHAGQFTNGIVNLAGSGEAIRSYAKVRADTGFNIAGTDGASGNIVLASTTSIQVQGGIIVSYS